MTKSKTDRTAIEFGGDQTIRITGSHSQELTFASRSAMEDVLTDVYRQGIAVGWTAGQLQLTREGQVVEDKTITRDADGRISGLVNRVKVILPGAALMTVPKPKEAA
jgi:hypothetical protein